MSSSENADKTSKWDFFVSYTAVDHEWAEWIAWQLEDKGYRVLVQAWDFVPGSNWVYSMHQGTQGAERTIAILSEAYLTSVFGQSEWQAAYQADPTGFERKLIPVRVEDCERPGLLASTVSFDLFGLAPERARQYLLDKVKHALDGRAKPIRPPELPGTRTAGAASAAPESHSAEPRRACGVAVVLTMIDAEYRAVRPYLGDQPRERVAHETIYEVGAFTGRNGVWTVAATEIGPGNDVAGVELERAVRVFSPDVVLLVGVAGGRKEAGLGDVVVADSVYDYESGKAVERAVLPRIKTVNPSYGLVQRSRQVARDGAWMNDLAPEHRQPPPPQVFVKPIAAGDKLIAHDQSSTARLIDANCGDAVAVEMEGVGFLRAVYRNKRVQALVVRGVSDLLTGKDDNNDRHWQPIAAARAAAFAFAVLGAYDTERVRSS